VDRFDRIFYWIASIGLFVGGINTILIGRAGKRLGGEIDGIQAKIFGVMCVILSISIIYIWFKSRLDGDKTPLS
jgi:hypothetical protein